MNLQNYPISSCYVMPQINRALTKTEITPEIIIATVSAQYGLLPEQIINAGRKRTIISARFSCISLLSEMFPKMTYNAIGGYFSGQDHATIINALRKHKDYLVTDEEYRNSFLAIKTRLEL